MTRRVAADVVRDHIAALRADGMAVTAIAAAAKLPTSTVYSIINWQRTWVEPATGQAILAVTSTGPTLPANLRPATAARRRLQAMVADGRGLSDIARQLGRPMMPLWKVATGRRNAVTVDTDEAIADLYERLLLHPGGSAHARSVAARNGWVPPEAWTDTTIGDPDAEPYAALPDADVDPVLVDLALRGHRRYADLNAAEQAELWKAWLRRRDVYGMRGPGVAEFRAEHGLTRAEMDRLRAAAEKSPESTTGRHALAA